MATKWRAELQIPTQGFQLVSEGHDTEAQAIDAIIEALASAPPNAGWRTTEYEV